MFERRDVEPTSKTFDGLVLPEVSVTRHAVPFRRRESNVEFERTKLLQRLSRLTGSVLSALPAGAPEISGPRGFIVRIDIRVGQASSIHNPSHWDRESQHVYS